MGKTKDSRKNNSKKYKSQLKKDIQKKMQENAARNRRVYSDISGGSRVVRHGKSSINAAPYYYGRKITRGGYAHYYPYQEGVIDKQMSKIAMVENAFRKQKAATAWQAMYQQGMSGELDDIPDETKRKIMDVQRGIEKQQKKEKLINEYTQKKKKLEDMTNANIGKLKGHANLYRKDKDGNPVISKSSTIREAIADVENETQHMDKKSKIIRELNEATDKNEEAKSLLQARKKEAKEKYKGDEKISKIIDNEDELRAEVMKRNRLVQDTNDNAKEYERLIQRQKEYADAERQVQVLRNELTAKTGWEDANIAGAIADVIRKNGAPEEMRASIDEIIKAAEGKAKTIKEDYERYHKKQQELDKNFEYYGAQMKNIRENLLAFFANTKHVNFDFKQKMHTKSMNELFQKAEQLRPYIPKEIAAQHEMIKNKYKNISKLTALLNKNNVEFIEPANNFIEKLKDLAARETTEYAEMMNESVSTDVFTPEQEEYWASKAVVIEHDELPH